MSKSNTFTIGTAVIIVAAVAVAALATRQDSEAEPAPARLSKPADLRWPLPSSAQAYASIDGDALLHHVEALVDISHKNRDQGNKYWGRIQGLDGDLQTQRWLAKQFERIGLNDVRVQSFDMSPQWVPRSWELRATGAGKTLAIETAHPALRSAATPPEGLDLEVVYAGLGTPADFAGRDVRGKAVLLYSVPYSSEHIHSAARAGALASAKDSPASLAPIRRAAEQGAAAIIVQLAVPGNLRTQFHPVDEVKTAPVVSIGDRDGIALRELIEAAGAGPRPRVRLTLEASYVSGLKTANVWGELKGTSDEHIVVIAHRDGFFEGADDNATGVATLVGLAEYFAKQPKESRRRTIHFIGTPGHHNYQEDLITGSRWIHAHARDLLAKTALIVNAEHTSGTEYVLHGPELRPTTRSRNFYWYLGGSDRLLDIFLSRFALFGVGLEREPQARIAGEISPLQGDAPTLHAIQKGPYFHSDRQTIDAVQASGLEATTRAFASVIDQVNRVDLKDLLPHE